MILTEQIRVSFPASVYPRGSTRGKRILHGRDGETETCCGSNHCNALLSFVLYVTLTLTPPWSGCVGSTTRPRGTLNADPIIRCALPIENYVGRVGVNLHTQRERARARTLTDGGADTPGRPPKPPPPPRSPPRPSPPPNPTCRT
jgi:hypothetical protein